jgi:hypothetical protein
VSISASIFAEAFSAVMQTGRQLASDGLQHIEVDNPLVRGMQNLLFPSSNQKNQTEECE